MSKMTTPSSSLRTTGDASGDAYASVKRGLDLLIALGVLLVLGPLMVVVMLLIRFDGGPALFRHERVGFGQHRFKCLKFRTMVVDADRVLEDLLARDPAAREEWERTRKLRRDPRVTALGRFLRSTSLDELPQVFNVLAGDMSIVGPRPIVEAEIPRYGPLFFYYTRCKPGVTGLWQVSGRSDVSYDRRIRLDETYFHDRSLVTDLVILWRTPQAVISRQGAH